MPVEIKIQLSAEAQRLVRDLETWPARMLRAVARALDRTNEQTVGAIVRNRLSFPKGSSGLAARVAGGLRVQTGRLRRSIRKTTAVISGNAVISAIGTDVEYAGVHEEGFEGVQHVRGHTRRFHRLGGGFKGRFITEQEFSRALRRKRRPEGLSRGLSFVRPHARKVNFPARRFISGTIEEREAIYTEALSQAILDTWEGGANG